MQQPLLSFPAQCCAWDELVISPSNASALKSIEHPEVWPTAVMCLYGARKSGVSTVVGAWAQKNESLFFDAKTFRSREAAQITKDSPFILAIDDADRITDEQQLLSWINAVAQNGGRILLGAHAAPQTWLARSPDLKSRLASMPTAQLLSPDEAMLMGRLRSGAEQHYLKLTGDVLYFLSQRVPQDYERIDAFLSELNEAVSNDNRPPTIPLIRAILEKTSQA